MKQNPDRMSFTIANIEDISSPKKGRKIVWDLRRPKLCIRITENGAKTFYYVTKVDGKTEWNKLGRFPDMTPEVARTRADVIAGEYGKGRNVAEEKREEKKEWTVGKAWEMYVKDRVRRLRDRGKSEDKIENALVTLNGYWNLRFTNWEGKRLSAITGGMTEQLQDKVLENRSGATANRVIATGRALFNFAIKRKASGFDGPNPFSGIEKQPEKRRKNKLRTSQIPAFFKALESVSPLMKEFFLMALWTGRRAGDLKSMRWVDVDLESGTWIIPDTKADESQEVALSDPAIEILATRKKSISSQWVFPSRSNSGHIEEYKKAWQQVRKEAGLEGLRLHDLRRSISSIAQENRIAAAVAGAQLGHKDPSTTMKHYTDIALYAQREAVNIVAQAILEAAKSD